MGLAGKWLTSLCLMVLAIFLFIQEGLSIECFICNSIFHGEDCESLPEHRQYIYKQNCDEMGENKNYTLCRKMIQNMGGDKRVIRQCAVRGDIGCIKRSGTKNVKIKYCHCEGNYCNQGTTLSNHLPICVSAALATFYLTKIYNTL